MDLEPLGQVHAIEPKLCYDKKYCKLPVEFKKVENESYEINDQANLVLRIMKVGGRFILGVATALVLALCFIPWSNGSWENGISYSLAPNMSLTTVILLSSLLSGICSAIWGLKFTSFLFQIFR
jgi:hypothetical protein